MLGPSGRTPTVCLVCSQLPPSVERERRATGTVPRGVRAAPVPAGPTAGCARVRRRTRSRLGRYPSAADTAFARSRRIPQVGNANVWSVWCIRVRPGHRGQGICMRYSGAPSTSRADMALPRSRDTRSTTAAKRSTSPWPMSARAGSSNRPASQKRQTPTRCSRISPSPHAARPELKAALEPSLSAATSSPASGQNRLPNGFTWTRGQSAGPWNLGLA